MKVGISISLSPELLAKIEENISGKNRAAKVRKCLQIGYKELVSKLVKEGESTCPRL